MNAATKTRSGSKRRAPQGRQAHVGRLNLSTGEFAHKYQ